MAPLRGLGTIGNYIAERTKRSMLGIVYDSLADMGADAIISALGGGSSPLGAMMRSFLSDNKASERHLNQIQRAKLRAERIAWLQDHQWMFDWRSQPRRPAGRPEGGEWMPGRLNYMREQAGPMSRTQLRKVRAHARWVKQNKKSNRAFKSRRNMNSSWASE